MARCITAGVDGSPESRAAVYWAAREAALRGLPLRLVHAWLWQPLDVPIVQDREAQAEAAEGLLREAESEIVRQFPEVPVSAEVVQETAVAALAGEAEHATMLALGSRGYGAVVGFLVGSYGQQVIASATCPVVAVRAPAGEDQDAVPEAGGGDEVVVGQQGSPEDCDAVLGFAFETAAAHGVGLRAVRAWSLPTLYTYSPASMALADAAGGLEPFERKALAEALQPWRERYPEVPVTEHVEIGSAGQVLVSATARARLLVVGRRARRSPVGSRIGSVAHAALHHAPCPVAVVPPA
ncbi:universal stress protein [Streptomyces pacificus]|uniref:Universal stress protein n=1 Tax=Streptomyces pacificus TaxID=2705029 RepID=A0A6A0ARF5_9ACTN|nr:universal stress protein [Streptomyces pacificus]GFH34504.1 universal stress protein [Streptomyces pacificus]